MAVTLCLKSYAVVVLWPNCVPYVKARHLELRLHYDHSCTKLFMHAIGLPDN